MELEEGSPLSVPKLFFLNARKYAEHPHRSALPAELAHGAKDGNLSKGS
jgi:hypothetical protein